MVRLLIFIRPPRYGAPADTESWLQRELASLCHDGVDRVQLRRLRSASPRLTATCAWMVELDCHSPEAACAAVGDGPGMMLLGDLRMLGMHPSVALVEEIG